MVVVALFVDAVGVVVVCVNVSVVSAVSDIRRFGVGVAASAAVGVGV